jgi:CubicO group peptidase (beta-lactamase class C family)
MILSHQSSIS